MKIDIQLLPSATDPLSLSNRAVVVIDVLRATSVIVHAISQGVIEVIPVVSVNEAFQIAKTFPQGSTLLGGERESRKIEGFDLGNSPREYIAERVKGKRLLLTTTNGTKAFHSISSGREVIAGSFFNIRGIVRRCLDLNLDLLIFPSGDGGRFSLEDTVCGGMLIDQIVKTGKTPIVLTDAALSAQILFQRFAKNIIEAFRLSYHGRDLMTKGFEEDLAYCARIDITDIVPTFQNGVIKIHEKAVG